MLKHAENLLKDILRFETPPSQLLSRYFRDNRQLGSRDRAVLSDIVYQVIREKAYFEYVLQQYPSGFSRERSLSILGVQDQAAWMQRHLNAQEQAWLASIPPKDATQLPDAVRYNLPEWLVQVLKTELGDDFEAGASGLLGNAPLDLRANILKGKRAQIQKQLIDSGVDVVPTPYSPWGLRVQEKVSLMEHPLYLDGSIEIQDEGSQLLALLVGAKRNDIIIDYCAGAGGKSLAMGSVMRNTGRIYAWDIVAYRLSALKPRMERSGLKNIFTAVLTHGEEARVRFLYGKADKVLVDAPCSGLGTLRRAPELKWRQTPKTITDLTQVQSLILNDAYRLVKTGGMLIYATCSFLPDENECIAQQFSQQHPEFEKVDMLELLNAQKVENAQTMVKNGYLRLWPHQHQTDGFFAAAWRRK